MDGRLVGAFMDPVFDRILLFWGILHCFVWKVWKVFFLSSTDNWIQSLITELLYLSFQCQKFLSLRQFLLRPLKDCVSSITQGYSQEGKWGDNPKLIQKIFLVKILIWLTKRWNIFKEKNSSLLSRPWRSQKIF